MADERIVDVSTILSKWHDLLKARWPNFPCQTFTMFMHNNSQELVRCRECMFSEALPISRYCLQWNSLVKNNGFCYKAKKKDGGAERDQSTK